MAGVRTKSHVAQDRGKWSTIFVRLGDLPQGFSLMTLLPARRLARGFAQTFDPSRLLQPVARRRLAAVRAVQSQPALKFNDPRFQSRDLSRLRGNQRNEFFPRWLGRRISIHRTLESKTDSAVQKNLQAQFCKTACPTWAGTPNRDWCSNPCACGNLVTSIRTRRFG